MPFTRAGGNRVVANRPYPNAVFTFTKTDNAGNPVDGDPLAGAIFHLHAWDDDADDWGTTPIATVTSAP